MKLGTAFKLIEKELEKAEKKFPGFPTDPVHAAAVVAEEAGELVKASLQFTYEHGMYADLLEEAVQTGAMSVRFLVTLEKMNERPSKQVGRK